jgi:PhnB protein
MDTTLVPYLNFNGNAAEAMKFYHSILGGELKVQTFGEAKMARSPEDNDKVVHATLKSGGFSFMASDTMAERQAKAGDNVHMSISGSDHAWLTEVFNKLSQGGSVDMPLAKQFWGDTYGQLTDKFGIHWMVDIAASPQQ